MEEITAYDLEEKLSSGEKVNIIDVREDEEVATGKIIGAKHIPLGEMMDRVTELDKNEHYYMVCAKGGRSLLATELLAQLGYQATNVDGGMMAWEGDVE